MRLAEESTVKEDYKTSEIITYHKYLKINPYKPYKINLDKAGEITQLAMPLPHNYDNLSSDTQHPLKGKNKAGQGMVGLKP